MAIEVLPFYHRDTVVGGCWMARARARPDTR